MVKESRNIPAFVWALPLCALVLCLGAWLRGAEYDEQYTLFLTAGVPRPDWPEDAFPAGLARVFQGRHTDMARIGHDLRVTDVHPPLYFWAVAGWRALAGDGLFAARLFSVAAGVGAVALVGVIARLRGVPAGWAMMLTMGCYGFVYTSVIARGFALAHLLVLGGMTCLCLPPRVWRFGLAGVLFGAATLTNYLAVFVAGAGLLAVGWDTLRGRVPWRAALAAGMGFLAFVPADLWWFLAQRGSRDGQFAPFAWGTGLAKLARDGAGAVLGGLPLYVEAGFPRMALSAALGLVLLGLAARVAVSRPGPLFVLAAMAPAAGLLALGLVFNNTPIELRYLSFSTPFVALLLAWALPGRMAAGVLAMQAVALAGLMLAPQTMQPARAAARALAGERLVLLPRGNDGVGLAGAFAIEAPPALSLLLIRPDESPDHIRTRLRDHDRVGLALLEQDGASRTASAAMRAALTHPAWREVARGDNIAVYERTGEDH